MTKRNAETARSAATELIAAAAQALAERPPRQSQPTEHLDVEIQRLVRAYGPAEVRAAAIRLSKGKTGRKEEKDWPLLSKIFRQDALDWLDGRDPAEIRSNNAISDAFAEANPGQSAFSTHRRIMGKLADKRQLFFLITAWEVSRHERPFMQYFRAVKALEPVASAGLRAVVRDEADKYLGKLQRYRAIVGEPLEAMTITQIEMLLDDIAARGLTLSNLLSDAAHLSQAVRMGEEKTSR